MLSIRLDSIESTQVIRINWSLWPCFKNEEGSCIIISRILTARGLCRVGWKCCRFDSIRSNRQESFPLLSIRHAQSRFANRVEPYHASYKSTEVCCHILRTRKVNVSLHVFHGPWLPVVRIDAMQIKSNCKVPHTNWLSLGVFDVDDYFWLGRIGLNMPCDWAKTGEYPRIFLNFQNCTHCKKDLKDNKHNSLHLGQKYASQDICPWTPSVPCSSQFSSSWVLGKLLTSRNR